MTWADLKGILWHRSSSNIDTRVLWMTVCLGTCTEFLLAQKTPLGRRLQLGLQKCHLSAAATGQHLCVLPSPPHLPTVLTAHGMPAW